MGRRTDVLTALTIPLLILLHLSVAPYTKIEESFTIQATHDVLSYGIPVSEVGESLAANFDHFTYPELHPVPRTFVAPLILAILAKPFVSLVNGIDKQILVRAILGTYNAFCLIFFRNCLRRAYGASTANWFSLFQACQFHIIFYASRTLPNFIPFGLSTVATGFLIQKLTTASKSATIFEPALVLLTVLGMVFRSELAIFLGTHTIYGFLRGRLSVSSIVSSGIIGVVVGLLLTVPIDSYMWQKYPLWPELTSFLFNIYEGKSVDWGVSPWHYYFANAVPKVLFNPVIYLICVPFAIANASLRASAIDLLVPNLTYIGIYSFQPHKEWRFVVYAIPAVTAAGARGAAWIWDRRTKSPAYGILNTVLILSCLASVATSFLFLAISSLNYPGAMALYQLQGMVDGTKPNINIHMDVLTAQTGATLFLQLPATNRKRNATRWYFDKTDDKTGDGTLVLRPEFWAKFDYALAEKPEKCIGAWEEIAAIEGLAGVGIVRPGDIEEESATVDARKLSQRAVLWGEAPWAAVTIHIWQMWKSLGTFMRQNVTRGWWIDVRLRPMIRILKRIPQDEVIDRILEQQ